MKFKLFREKFNSASLNSSSLEKLRAFLRENRNRVLIGGFSVATALATIMNPGKALAEEAPAIIDTTTPTTLEQTYVAPAEDVSEVTPAETQDEVAPAQNASEVAPAEIQDEVTPAENASEVTPSETQDEVTPAENASEVTPAETQDEVAPAQSASEVAPSETQDEVTPAENASEVAPAETQDEVTPAENTKTNTAEDVRTDSDALDSNISNTQEQVNNENIQKSSVKHFDGYDLIEKDGQLIVIGKIPAPEILAQQLVDAGVDISSGNVTAYDFENIIKTGQFGKIADTGYSVVEGENGTVFIKDEDGNVILTQSAENKVQDNTNVQDGENKNDQVVSENKIVVGDNQYVILQDDGVYYLAVGGVGLSNNQFQDLVSRLQAEGKIPADAIVNLVALPDAPTDNMEDDVRHSYFGNYDVETVDGNSYIFKYKGENYVATVAGVSDQLEENKKTSENPDATPSLKPSHDDNNPEEPKNPGDKPKPDTPDTPDIPNTPEQPSVPVTPQGKLPQTGDEANVLPGILAGIGAAALSEAERRKRNKTDKDKSVDDLKTINNEGVVFSNSKKDKTIDEQVDEIMRRLNKKVYGVEDINDVKPKVR